MVRGGPLLFVYGTLRPGGVNAHRMRRARHIGAASVLGRLYMLARYPALVNDRRARVRGDVWRLPAGMLGALDAFEGTAYVRRRKRVVLDNGARALAWAYLSTRPPVRRRRVLSGDLMARGG
jgi:gamma-glutamylcyclotransferase (GGCT)/AIG2-like uncharacterized protein YtfP